MRSLVFGLLMSINLAQAADSSVAPIHVPRVKGSITLDGRLHEAAWRQAVRLPEQAFFRWIADIHKQADSPFHLRFMHDGNTLYVALVSYDRFVEPDAVPGNSDGLYSLSIQTKQGALLHYRLRWSANPPAAGDDMERLARWGAHLRGPFADGSREGGGYVFEIAIPLKETGWKTGDRVPVNIIVIDHDGKPHAAYNAPGVEFSKYAWGSLDNDERNAYRMLELSR